jgi:C4-dicarboxylate-specific signal transduction histidine kinase
MLSLGNLSIRRKQMLIIMLTSSVALLLACAAFVAYDTITFREQLVKKESTVADVVGKTVPAAIDFNDPKTAEESLGVLRAEPSITSACIYDGAGKVFATYRRDRGTTAVVFPAVRAAGHEFIGDRLRLFLDIQQGGGKVGTIFVVADLNELSQRLKRYAGIVGLVYAVSFLIALALSSRLQRVVSDPILHLAQVARSVALDKNYSVRATRKSSDELGHLIDGFNAMLDQIQQRDAALEAARNQLEHRVEERTAELAESLSVLNATLGSTADGILVINNCGKKILQNQRTVDLWKIPPPLAEGDDAEAALRHGLRTTKDPERFQEKALYFYAHPEASGQDEIELQDGTILERHTAPVLGKAGKNYGRIWTFRDVTERKQAEARLQALHQQLLETSRLAGMAEVATNVLHNVGNVLNSVNVSAGLVADNAKKSKVSYLGKVVALLNEHAADLGTFITADPKGRQLPGYLSQLAEQLAREQLSAITELELLRQNIEHIKEIVAMQQNHALVSGLKEIINLKDLVEDSLRMNDGAMQRHQITILREFDPVPSVNVEKHKIMQILVNLIRNAKHACEDTGRADKRITVGLTNGDGRIKISVADNGVGIPAENLARIFNHGFTTRKDGHGFGLHSGALAAKELGGSLTAHSPGPGRGATFILELPGPLPILTTDL